MNRHRQITRDTHSSTVRAPRLQPRRLRVPVASDSTPVGGGSLFCEYLVLTLVFAAIVWFAG